MAEEMSLQDLESSLGDIVDVVASCIKSPMDVYLQPKAFKNELLQLQHKLNIVYGVCGDDELVPEARQTLPGSLAAARFAADDSFYRISILKRTSASSALIRFIDYGNTTEVPIAELKYLLEGLAIYPRFSIRCGMTGLACYDDENLSQAMRDILMEELKTPKLVAKFDGKEGDLIMVTLYSVQEPGSTEVNINEVCKRCFESLRRPGQAGGTSDNAATTAAAGAAGGTALNQASLDQGASEREDGRLATDGTTSAQGITNGTSYGESEGFTSSHQAPIPANSQVSAAQPGSGVPFAGDPSAFHSADQQSFDGGVYSSPGGDTSMSDRPEFTAKYSYTRAQLTNYYPRSSMNRGMRRTDNYRFQNFPHGPRHMPPFNAPRRVMPHAYPNPRNHDFRKPRPSGDRWANWPPKDTTLESPPIRTELSQFGQQQQPGYPEEQVHSSNALDAIHETPSSATTLNVTGTEKQMDNLSISPGPKGIRLSAREGTIDPDTYGIHVSHVISPAKFYVLFTEDMDLLINYRAAMTLHYNEQRTPGPEGIIPRSKMAIGSAWAVRSPLDDQWYRAEVVGTSPAAANVMLPDTGLGLSCPVADIRILDDQFASFPKLAIEACLLNYDPQAALGGDLSVKRFKEFSQPFEKEFGAIISVSTELPAPVTLEIFDLETKVSGLDYIMDTAHQSEQQLNVDASDEPVNTMSSIPSATNVPTSHGHGANSLPRDNPDAFSSYADDVNISDPSVSRFSAEGYADSIPQSAISPDGARGGTPRSSGSASVPSSQTVPVHSVESEFCNIYPKQDCPPDEADVTVNYVDSPNGFWLMLSNQRDSLTTILSQLLEDYNEEMPAMELSDIRVGNACVCRYVDDGCWYRAEIKSILSSGKSAMVQFVDYGNAQTVSLEEIKPLRRKYMVPPLVYSCRLSGLDEKRRLADVDREKFQSILCGTGSSPLPCRFFTKDRVPYEVVLFDPNTKESLNSTFLDYLKLQQ